MQFVFSISKFSVIMKTCFTAVKLNIFLSFFKTIDHMYMFEQPQHSNFEEKIRKI